MEKRNILTKIIDYYTSGNKSKFAKMLNLKPQTISAWVARNTFDADIITTYCSDINPQFILTGEGPMLLEEDASTGEVHELRALVAELKQLRTDIHAELEEQRKLHRETTEVLCRAVDIILKKASTDNIRDIALYSHNPDSTDIAAEPEYL